MTTMGTFKRYWSNLHKDEKEQLANRMETSVNYLSQVAHGHKKPGKQFIALLEVRLGRNREELFGNAPPALKSVPASNEALSTRLQAVQSGLGIDSKVDRRVLEEAMAWYRMEQRDIVVSSPEELMHACKEALMHSTRLSRHICWFHAALAWELTR